MIRPGVTFGAVVAAIERIVRDAGYWHIFPQIHGLNPICLVGPVGNAPDQYQPTRGADIVLREGMTFSLENGTIAGRIPLNQVKIGGSGVVTAHGFDLWNVRGLELQKI